MCLSIPTLLTGPIIPRLRERVAFFFFLFLKICAYDLARRRRSIHRPKPRRRSRAYRRVTAPRHASTPRAHGRRWTGHRTTASAPPDPPFYPSHPGPETGQTTRPTRPIPHLKITPNPRGPTPAPSRPENLTNPHSHTRPNRPNIDRATTAGDDAQGRRNGGRLPLLRLLLLLLRAAPAQAPPPPQPGRAPPPPRPAPDPRAAIASSARPHRRASPAAGGRRPPARRLPLLPLPARPRRGAAGARGGGGGAEGGGEGRPGGATDGGVRGAAVPPLRGAAALARRRAGVALQALPALRPLLRAQLVQRQGGRLRALGPPPRRPPRLLLLLPRHGLRHPRPGAAPPRRPRLPPLPRGQPQDARARRRRRRRHLPLHVHLRAQDHTDTLQDEPGAAANRAELRRRIRRFHEEDGLVFRQGDDGRREAEIVRGNNCVAIGRSK